MSLNPTVEDYHSLEDDDDEATHPFFVKQSSKNVLRKRSSPKTAPSISSGRSDSGYSSYTTRTRSSAGSEFSFTTAPQPTAKPLRNSGYDVDTKLPENRKQSIHSDDDSHSQVEIKQVRSELGRMFRHEPKASRRRRATEREDELEGCTDPSCTTCYDPAELPRIRDRFSDPVSSPAIPDGQPLPPVPYPPHPPSGLLARHDSSQPYSQRYYESVHYASSSRSIQYHGSYGHNPSTPWNVHYGGLHDPSKRPEYPSPELTQRDLVHVKAHNNERRPLYFPTIMERQRRVVSEQSPQEERSPGQSGRQDGSTFIWPSKEIFEALYRMQASHAEEENKADEYESKMRDLRLYHQAREKVKSEINAHRDTENDKRKRYSSCDRRIPHLHSPPINPLPFDETRLSSSVERPQSPKQKNVSSRGTKPPNKSPTARTTSPNFSQDVQPPEYSVNASKVVHDEATGMGSESTITPMGKVYSYSTSNDFLEREATPDPNGDRSRLGTIEEEKDLSAPTESFDHSEELSDGCEVDVDDALNSAVGIVQTLLLRQLLDYALSETTDASHESTDPNLRNSGNATSESVSCSSAKSKSSSQSIKRLRGSGRDPGDDDGDNSDDEDRPNKRGRRGLPDRFPQRRLKCPFYQRQPEKYNKAACRGTGFVDMAKLKDHIKRVHTQPLRCSRCWLKMESDEVFSEHLQQINICQIAPEPQDERIRPQLLKRLDFKKAPYSKARNVDEKWKILYTVLFPNDSNIPSPYEQQGMSPQLERVLYEALEEELTRELSAVIGPIMAKIKDCIPAIIKNCRQKLRGSSPTSDDETIFTPSGTSVTSSDKTGRENSTGSHSPLTDSLTSARFMDDFEISSPSGLLTHMEQRHGIVPVDPSSSRQSTENPLACRSRGSDADHDMQASCRHDSCHRIRDHENIYQLDPNLKTSACCANQPDNSGSVVRCTDVSISQPCSTVAGTPQQSLSFLFNPESNRSIHPIDQGRVNSTQGQSGNKHLEDDLTHDSLAAEERWETFETDLALAGDWWESFATDFDMMAEMEKVQGYSQESSVLNLEQNSV